MIQNYFKVAIRNLLRHKGFTLTNLLGLSIGITCTILILLWVKDELTYNKFHANYENVHQVMANRDFNKQIFTDPNMVLPLASTIAREIPEVKDAVVTTGSQRLIITHKDIKLKKEGLFVSDKFFSLFSWKFLEGNVKTALSSPSSIVLTQSTAKAIFGNENPIDKTISLDGGREARVSAIVADPPGNSTVQFDYVMPFNYSDPDVIRSMAEWTNSSWKVYINVKAGTNMALLDKKITALKLSHDAGDKAISTYFTFPMGKWRLYSDFKDGKNTGGMIEYVKMFSIIAVIILVIACVNFMNLSTARSERRAKEVGIRKTLGSDKKQLMLQFYFESLILALAAFLISIAAVYLLLPSFNSLVDKHLVFDLSKPYFWLVAGIIILFTGIVAGSYPALYLSSFNPVKVLKGSMLTGKKAALPRHILVTGQFIISFLLISATITVYKQIQHIKDRAIGYDPNNLVMIPVTPDTQKNFEVIKTSLLQSGSVAAVTRTFSPITEIWWKSGSPDWEGKPANLNILMNGMQVDVDFTKALGIKMVEGHDFTGMPSDSAAMLLNKSAVAAMGLKKPIGMQMRYGDRAYTVIGITDNVMMESPFKPVDPIMIYFNPDGSNSISIRMKSSVSVQQGIASIEKIFKQYNPSVPFEYQFVDQEFSKKFLAEDLISKLTNIFAELAIFICCIGLAGLASFTIEKRIKEIGIRKVLGATVPQVLMLVSRDFLKLVLIAFLIAVPIAWWGLHNWLQNYTYHIDVSIWLFLIVGALVLLLTLIVVSLNVLKAAVANPVKSLRTE